MKKIICLLSLVFLSNVSLLFAQKDSANAELKENAPKVYLNCSWCDREFMKKDISFVNFLREPSEADIVLLITTLSTSGGGTQYNIEFVGQKKFENMNDTLKYFSKTDDSDDVDRKGLSKLIKLGLVKYVIKSPIADDLSINYEKELEPMDVDDPWDSWVFTISANSYLSGEKLTNFQSSYGSISSSRVTPDWKFNISLSGSYNASKYTLADETIATFTRSKSFNTLMVNSIDEHISIGGHVSMSESSYSNLKFGAGIYPAIEYDVYPYSESTSRQLTFLYQLGYKFNRYSEETIYDKTSEYLKSQELIAGYMVKEVWGSVNTSISLSHYFHDFKKNNVSIWSSLSIFIFKGLSFNLYGSFSMIHDQLYLPKGGATKEEILLRRRAIETTYDYYTSFGLRYTFGSIYSNVVNPRFGDY